MCVCICCFYFVLVFRLSHGEEANTVIDSLYTTSSPVQEPVVNYARLLSRPHFTYNVLLLCDMFCGFAKKDIRRSMLSFFNILQHLIEFEKHTLFTTL